MKKIQEMNPEEIIDHLIQDRGLNPKDQKLRKDYSLSLVWKPQRGDVQALNELLKIGKHFSGPTPMFE